LALALLLQRPSKKRSDSYASHRTADA
jgi:hypothetical protein